MYAPLPPSSFFIITLSHTHTFTHKNHTGGGGAAGGGGGGGGGSGPRGINPAGPVGALLGIAGIAYGGYNSFYTVEGGHRALLFNRLVGVKEEVKLEGMHFMVPWFEYPIIYDVRPKPRMIQSLTGSKGRRVCVCVCMCVCVFVYICGKRRRRGRMKKGAVC